MPVTEVYLTHACMALTNKSVAIVGNSPVILEQGYGKEIDAHDVVIRMNGATPCRFPEHRQHIGSRTDVLTCGEIRPYEEILKEMPPWFWWMKLTDNGTFLRKKWRKWMAREGHDAQCFVYPITENDRLMRESGASPSSGIRAIDVVCNHAKPKSVDIYGMTFWGHTGEEQSWYSGNTVHRSHVPALEYAYFRKTYPFDAPAIAGRWIWTP